MLSTRALLHFAAYSESPPAAATIPSKLVKETVYMPSSVAARVLGNGERGKEEATDPHGDGSCDVRDG